jgi:protein-L-isoaspartate(D-aspartate) O-methyltransferase
MPDYSELRERMVANQVEARGVRSKKVLDAMRKVPREQFLPEGLKEFAYEDSPLPIEAGQTISQPYIVAFMIEGLVLHGGEKVLEIGAGSGYAAAVLAEIAGEVYTIERLGSLAERATAALAAAGYDNVHVLHADGTLGWSEHAPFDGIVVTAGGPEVPRRSPGYPCRPRPGVSGTPAGHAHFRIRIRDGDPCRSALRAAGRRRGLGYLAGTDWSE